MTVEISFESYGVFGKIEKSPKKAFFVFFGFILAVSHIPVIRFAIAHAGAPLAVE